MFWRIYIVGEAKDWAREDFTKKSGRHAHDVRVEYEQLRAGYQRPAFAAQREDAAGALSRGSAG